MIEYSEIFQLLAELAIAVAGFAGVATVFGGQDRAFHTAEILRLRALFQFAAQIIVCSLGVITMDASGIPRELNVLCISVATAMIGIVFVFDVPLKAVRLRGEFSSVTPSSIVIAFSPSVICVPLLLLNAFWLRQEWLLIAVLSYFICMALWIFYRLLVNRS